MEFELLITELDQTTIQLDKINFLAKKLIMNDLKTGNF